MTEQQASKQASKQAGRRSTFVQATLPLLARVCPEDLAILAGTDGEARCRRGVAWCAAGGTPRWRQVGEALGAPLALMQLLARAAHSRTCDVVLGHVVGRIVTEEVHVGEHEQATVPVVILPGDVVQADVGELRGALSACGQPGRPGMWRAAQPVCSTSHSWQARYAACGAARVQYAAQLAGQGCGVRRSPCAVRRTAGRPGMRRAAQPVCSTSHSWQARNAACGAARVHAKAPHTVSHVRV